MDILDKSLGPHPDAMASKVGDEKVMLHLGNATYYGLDPIGSVIWDGLCEGKLPRAICAAMAEDFAVDVAVVAQKRRSHRRTGNQAHR